MYPYFEGIPDLSFTDIGTYIHFSLCQSNQNKTVIDSRADLSINSETIFIPTCTTTLISKGICSSVKMITDSSDLDKLSLRLLFTPKAFGCP